MGAFQPTHLLVIVLVALVLFAAPKLPQIARNLGESMRVFRSEVKQMKDESGDTKTDADAPVAGIKSTGTGSTAADETVTGRVVDGDTK